MSKIDVRFDEELDPQELEFARSITAQVLEDWADAGNSPSTLFCAMVEIVNEILEAAGSPVQ